MKDLFDISLKRGDIVIVDPSSNAVSFQKSNRIALVLGPGRTYFGKPHVEIVTVDRRNTEARASCLIKITEDQQQLLSSTQSDILDQLYDLRTLLIPHWNI